MKTLKTHKSFGGVVQFWEHDSVETKTKMKFSTFVPDGVINGCVFFLAGLECTEETFMAKAGAQRVCAELRLIAVCPDTSPRGLQLPSEHESWDFGSGAGFYVDATTDGYRDHYRMYSYVANELYSLINEKFGLQGRISIMGHSMGGHGALVIGLREPLKFKSVSALAPIAHPTLAPWGEKALTGYLGDDRSTWKTYDACELIAAGAKHSKALLVDQGTSDAHLAKQLFTQDLVKACEQTKQFAKIQMREGYDHGYYFVSSFVESHLRFHADSL